jgi:putative phosphoesterase
VSTSRLALISDQHGNDVAFEAVVADLDRIGVDDICCLGDAFQGGPQPLATLDRLNALGCRTVLGNADDFIVEVQEDSPEPINEKLLEVREWTRAQLGETGLEAIREFEPRIELNFAGYLLVCFHGSPQSYDDVLLPEVDRPSLDPYRVRDADLLAGGHTHRQWARTIDGSLFVNPGSVGFAFGRLEPREAPVPLQAEYALVVADPLGLSVEFRHVQYSFSDLERAVLATDRPYKEDWLAQWAVPNPDGFYRR